jgi:hypothetical protein
MMKLVSVGAVIGVVVCCFASSAPAATGEGEHSALACVGAGGACSSSSECCGTMMCKLQSGTTKQFCRR